ncbi:MAG: hypothetical protein C0485_17535 [Pirellula sp.]|nr:hypothetical protein [Pirellula sp.]
MTRRLIGGLTLLLLASGCRDGTTKIAREAADRQARQNEQIARTARESSQATRRLIEEESQARRELLATERQLQEERARLIDSWNDLEARRQAAHSRERTIAAGQTVAAALATLLALSIAWRALAARSPVDLDAACWLLDLHDPAASHVINGPSADLQLPHLQQETNQ